jgi:hypothetical protein
VLRLRLFRLHGQVTPDYVVLGGHLICRCVQVHLLSKRKILEKAIEWCPTPGLINGDLIIWWRLWAHVAT